VVLNPNGILNHGMKNAGHPAGKLSTGHTVYWKDKDDDGNGEPRY